MPTDTIYTTPWHCTAAYKLDGTVTTGMRSELEKDESLELIHEDGRPSYFREISPLLSWAEDRGGISCIPLYPCGWLLKPAQGAMSLSVKDIDAPKVRSLSERNSPIVLRGFANAINRDLYLEKAHRFGTPLPWKFGLVLEVKDQGDNSRGLNNVLSAEWMPFHYDGLFKTEKRTDEQGEETLVSTPPK